MKWATISAFLSNPRYLFGTDLENCRDPGGGKNFGRKHAYSRSLLHITATAKNFAARSLPAARFWVLACFPVSASTRF